MKTQIFSYFKYMGIFQEPFTIMSIKRTRVFDIEVIFQWEVTTDNKRLLLLTSSILQTSSVEIRVHFID